MLYDNNKNEMMMGAVLVHTGTSTTYKNEFTVRVKREKRSCCVLCVVHDERELLSHIFTRTYEIDKKKILFFTIFRLVISNISPSQVFTTEVISKIYLNLQLLKMVETINATVFKDSIDAKVGLSVEERGGKILVTGLTGLFGATGK